MIMSNRQHATGPTESFEMSEQDAQDLQKLAETGEVTYHTILEVWQHQLAPAGDESTRKVAPGWASRITAMYPQIKMQQMTEFRDRYFGKISELKSILDLEIASDPDCFSYQTPQEDAENNSHHYKNLLLQWQSQIVQWEAGWSCEDELAPVELGAISEVHKMFFNEVGVTAFLDNIGFEFTESDQAEMSAALNELKEASGE